MRCRSISFIATACLVATGVCLLSVAGTAAENVVERQAFREKPLAVEIVRAFPQLKFRRPLLITHAPDNSDRVFVVSQLGTIHVFANRDQATRADTFIDISSRVRYSDRENEEGLLGLAFHPDYKQNGQFFLFYTTTDAPHTSVISRFRVSRDANRAREDSEEEIMRIPKPYWNHNGGTLIFGDDGYLYIALGDGGSAGDPQGNGQNLATLLGSILRIDVDRRDVDRRDADHRDAGRRYGIPKDNPFVDLRGARPEIWAYGLRNVWRMAFDRETGQLWAADVGQDRWEEIDLIVRGGNYGWNLREGKHTFKPPAIRPGVREPKARVIEPIWEYSHDAGKSITGGLVYRGKKVPELVGKYLYGDYVSGRVWALEYSDQQKRVVANYSIRGNTLPLMSFGEDQHGEAYFAVEHGMIYRFRSKKP